MKVLWDELDIYTPISNCTCIIRCSSESTMQERKNYGLLYAIRFLTCLIVVVMSQILLMDPLPPMNNIFSVIIQYERQGNFAPVDDSQALISAF